VQDPYNGISGAGYDVLNRSVWTTSPLYNDTTKFRYDSLDNVTAVTDSKSQIYTSHRNVLGWVVQTIDPAARSDSTAYDVAGNVAYVRTRQGRQVRFEYDALNRMTKKIGVTGADTIAYAYDAASRWVAARTVSRGSLVSIDTIFTDSIGRTIKEQTTRPGVGIWAALSYFNSTDAGRTYVHMYRSIGVVPEGGTYYYYDATKRLWMLQPVSAGQTTFGFDAEQLPSTVAFPSGLTETTTYTSSHALAKRSYNVAAVQNAFFRSYRTDSLARLVERASGDTTKFQTFDFDLKGRLASWQKKSQTGTKTCVNSPSGYGYDCSGTAVTTDQAVTATYDNVENPTDLGGTTLSGNRLQTYNGFTMAYDYDGNLASKGTDTYDWDDFGQLKGVTRSGTLIASFDYDGFGRRVRKWSSAGTVQYVWDGDQVILEADASGTTTQAYSYYPGIDRLHSVTAGGQTYYASIEPATGDVNGLVRGSDNAVVTQYAYTPWGEFDAPDQDQINGQRVNSLRWKGLPYDVETGLYYMRARYYDPKTRRFISEDPIGLAGGINEYVFASGDPVNGSDPSGLDGNGGCWALDYTVQYGSSEPFRHYVQVACPAGQALGEYQGGYWGPSSPGGLSGQRTFTNSGRESSTPSRASVVARKILACSDEAVGFGLSFMGSKGFYEGAKLTSGLAKNALRAIRSNAGAGGSLRNAARNAADIVLYSGASVRAGSETLGALGGAGAIGFHDTYFSPATARNALELVVGFIPVIGTVYAGGQLVSCLFQN
jgi:RHS repeat-associated protein